jgi:hypothetical protein
MMAFTSLLADTKGLMDCIFFPDSNTFCRMLYDTILISIQDEYSNRFFPYNKNIRSRD